MPFLGIKRHTRLMLVAEPIRGGRTKTRKSGPRKRRQALPPLDQVKLHSLRSDQLRVAIRSNLVTFPSQVPVFERHDRPDLQRRIVQLYFLLGWSCETIAARFGLLRQRIGQVLNTWKRRAVEMGYIQVIPPPASIHPSRRPIQLVFSPVVSDSGSAPAPQA
jgi:hypothetical protein